MNLAAKLAPAGAEIKLQTLKLHNFKGVKEFSMDIMGRNANIYADNAGGKTTLYDAFLWLLFDKDSANRTTFNVKTLDATGEALHMLEHTVEAVLSVNGEPLTLKKTLTEKWTKKRGSAHQIFDGHNTAYWVNEVPTKAGEYKQVIASLINEGLFRLITNPMYFNVDLPWKDRRKTLLEICGDVSESEVIASDAKLARLTGILNGKTIDDYRKIMAERVKKLTDEKEKIPPRIDELTRTMEGAEPDYSLIETRLVDCKATMDRIESQMVSASEVMKDFRKRQAELNGLYADLGKKRSELERQANAGRNSLVEQERSLTRTFADLTNAITTLESKQSLNQKLIEGNNTQLAALRTEWSGINAQTFTEPSSDDLTCPTCGQGLPCDQREERIGKARAAFEMTKKKGLDHNVFTGKSLKATNDELTAQLTVFEQEIAEKKGALNDIQVQMDSVKAQLDEPHETQAVESHPEYQAIQSKIDALQEELQQAPEDASAGLLQQKREVTAEIEGLNRILNNKEVRAKTNARIGELKEEERKLALQIAEFEGHKFMIEQFVQAKVALLETQINSRFRTVTWKMFKEQINGGIDECCEAMINGVPFSDANNAAKINAGLDIIDTLSKHYGVSAPIFIDNSEAVVRTLPIDAQVIKLIVSGQDKTLRVEMEA